VRFDQLSFRLGPHTISPATILAPIASISVPPFRSACLELECGLAVTEMIAARQLLVPRLWRKRPPFGRAEGERLLHVQIFGNTPELLAEGALAAEAHGADVIDVNLGCPARKVVSSGSGAALGREPAAAAAAVEAVVRAVKVPVTAKVRAGWDADSINVVDCARALEAAGAAALAVHPRTRMQMFSGKADWSLIARVVQAVRIPVIGNGDVRTAVDARRLLQDTGCAAVMVGRGALGRPWVFRALARGDDAEPSAAERMEIFRRYVRRYVDWAGADRAVRELRKHLLWFVRGVPGAAAFRGRALSVKTPEALEALLAEASNLLGAGEGLAMDDDGPAPDDEV
jgi:tRNA-dihydrouridine synthase B